MGIYGWKGDQEAHISGYYPIDTMRDILKNISIAHETSLKVEENLKIANEKDSKDVVERNEKPTKPLTEKTVPAPS